LLGDSVVVLERNYRFGASSGIGALSRAVNSGDSQHAMELLLSGGSGDLAWRDLPDRIQMAKALEPLILGGYADLFQAASVEAGFAALSRFRILCAIREGPYGVAAVNALAEELHRKANRTPLARWWYAGQPFLITVNDYSLRLFNGDVGLAFPSGSNGFSEGALKAYFEREENTYRTLLLQRLPDHTPVYAMTVHRSQGSEYDRVLLILPDRPLPVVTRELVYTAITRARCSVEIWGRREHFEKAIKTRIERTSGLHCLLHSSALLR
jgi:exodeoxyribonuclease V alpha subunit